MYIFTSEAVGAGHPDKIADQIADAILDYCLTKEPNARVACEVLVTTNLVVVAGEIAYLKLSLQEVEELVRNLVKTQGYSQNGFRWDELTICNYMHAQSTEISSCVEGNIPNLSAVPLLDKKSPSLVGAGDQGIMFGHATVETPTLMPAPIYYAHKILLKLNQDRLLKKLPYIMADGKSQISCVYDKCGSTFVPVGIDTIVLSINHDSSLSPADVEEIGMHYIQETVPAAWLSNHTKYYINPSGTFIQGGPMADTGLTGRKIIVDTYGGMVAHGGGAFSGKDATKMDRSGAYLARYLAKNIVAAKLAMKCTIQISYAIGMSQPISLFLDCHGTNTLDESVIISKLCQLVDMTPLGINRRFNLCNPIYRMTAVGGHFGRDHEFGGNFPWEQTDLQSILNADI